MRYKILPVICHPGKLSPFNLFPTKLVTLWATLRVFKLIPDEFVEPPTALFVDRPIKYITLLFNNLRLLTIAILSNI